MAVIFEIHDNFRVKNSPFFIEGTNVAFDVAQEISMPNETVAYIDGKPKPIRFLMDCDTIIKEEQIQRGFPADRTASDMERRLLTFVGGRLAAPEEYEHLVAFLESAPWFDEYKGVRPPGVRVMYRKYQQEKEEQNTLLQEELIMLATQWILAAQRDAAVDMLRLFNPGSIVSAQTDLKTIKVRLLEVAKSQPQFILDGIKTNRDRLVVLCSKAVDYEILNLDIAGQLALKSGSEIKPFARVLDSGGRRAKLERAVAFFESSDGKPWMDAMARQVAEFEALLEGRKPVVDAGVQALQVQPLFAAEGKEDKQAKKVKPQDNDKL